MFPIKDKDKFLVGIDEPRHFFQLLSNVSYDFEYIWFKKRSMNFWTLPLFYLISLNFGRSLIRNRQISIPFDYYIFFGNGLIFRLCFDTTRFQILFFFNFIFELNRIFYESISFPSQIITLLSNPIENKHNFKFEQRWKKRVSVYFKCFCWIVYAFWAEAKISRKILCIFLFFLCLYLLLLLSNIYLLTIRLNCFPRAYNST